MMQANSWDIYIYIYMMSWKSEIGDREDSRCCLMMEAEVAEAGNDLGGFGG